MTDLQNFIALYDSFGVDIKPVDNMNGTVVHLTGDSVFKGDLEMTVSDKFDGYGGFYSTIYFDKCGKFIKQVFSE